LLGLTACTDERACPAHAFWKEARQQIESALRNTTLADVIAHEHILK
jgi:DNA-binding IscR family transcriptional regulator